VQGPAALAASRAQPLDLPEYLVTGHGRQQPHQMSRAVKVVLPRGSADEETCQHRLANIHRIEQAADSWVGQASSDRSPQGWSETLDQFGRRSFVASSHPLDQVVKGSVHWSILHLQTKSFPLFSPLHYC
jgi:hypothetical protein